MSDETPPSSYAPFIALAVILALFILALVGALVLGVLLLGMKPAAATPHPAALLNRLAVIADDHIYTINPDGSHRVDLNSTGTVPTAGVIWSHDGQRLIFASSDRSQTRLSSARLDGQDARVLYEAERVREPFYLSGSPDDKYVAFLVTDPATGMELQVADTARPNSARTVLTGQPNYSAWSPDSQSLLVHVGGTSGEAFVGTYQVNAATTQKIENQPAAFQAPVWSSQGERPLLYARQPEGRGELVSGDGHSTRTLAEFDGGIVFGLSPDSQRVAYSINTPQSFLYDSLTLVELSTQNTHTYFKGDVLAFFWSPNGQKLAYLTGVLVEPSSVGRAAGLAAPRLEQQRTLQVTWHVLDLPTQQITDLNTFQPTESFLYLLQYFDQFAQSVSVWSPDSRALVYAGQPLVGERGIYVVEARSAAEPRYVGPGDFAIWSWH